MVYSVFIELYFYLAIENIENEVIGIEGEIKNS